MANLVTKLWKYLTTWGHQKFEENADPKVQIQQAIEQAQRQHQSLAQQAATVIGQQRQQELRLNRQLKEIDDLNDNIRQALMLADQAQSEGNESKYQQYNNAAENFAQQLAAAEENVEDTKNLLHQATQASAQAKAAVERSQAQLESTLNERTHLLNQLEQAKMQEQVGRSLSQVNGMIAGASAPNFDDVRNKIESRYAQSSAQAEIAQNSTPNQLAEVRINSRQLQGKKKLDEIRNQLNLPATEQQKQITSSESEHDK